AVHDWETRLGQARQQIAASEATATHEASLSSDLETQLARTQVRVAELSAHVTTLAASTAQAAAEWHDAEAQGQQQRKAVAGLEAELRAASHRLNELHVQIEADKNEHLEQMRHAGKLHNDAVSHKAHLDNLARGCERLRHKTDQAAEHLASLDLVLQE